MKTRIKVITSNSGITIYTAQYKGYGKINNIVDFLYLILNPFHGLRWNNIEEDLFVQYGPDDNGEPYSFERAKKVIIDFTSEGKDNKINKISYIVYP